ncbi:hypothetical protein [Enterobacter asburiae]|uniref:hypothetical protein n=1 Tax=Enterobacter asburiae TaxID=61645 RepID=UPI00192B40D1|nr:hypothetical protein [Enterobacter asburiae]MBL5838520.1 hypothetical protein [Enterobacter asburiae]MBL5939140.1 hypothetical protein [Enterobacter asburiae]MBL5961301.1 hypothetical protein [Enterobacter asburiae]MBL5972173.1 hypothetical protein [Enterobacter asburiae]
MRSESPYAAGQHNVFNQPLCCEMFFLGHFTGRHPALRDLRASYNDYYHQPSRLKMQVRFPLPGSDYNFSVCDDGLPGATEKLPSFEWALLFAKLLCENTDLWVQRSFKSISSKSS